MQVGDHVVTVFVPSCGECPPCAQQRPALCEPGFKANVAGSLLIDVNMLFKLNENGLRDKLTPLIGLEYSF